MGETAIGSVKGGFGGRFVVFVFVDGRFNELSIKGGGKFELTLLSLF